MYFIGFADNTSSSNKHRESNTNKEVLQVLAMDLRGLAFALVALSWAAICYAEDTNIVKRAIDDEADLLEDDTTAADKRIFRYGRGSIFRYGRAPAVFRYGKRAPVFRYGKRSDEEVDMPDNAEAIKRLFRWGKRDDEPIKRLFRWGKRADEDEDEKRSPVFRYGKRDDSSDDYAMEADKRRIFNFGKRDQPKEVELRAETPHVPFRFGDERE